jgi:hypothetical protein
MNPDFRMTEPFTESCNNGLPIINPNLIIDLIIVPLTSNSAPTKYNKTTKKTARRRSNCSMIEKTPAISLQKKKLS